MSERDRYPSELAERFQVRLPEGLRDRIRIAAEDNNRSMNAEIVSTLLDAYPQPLSLSDLAKQTRILVEEVKRFRSTSSLVELHNVLAEAAHELKALESSRHDEDMDPDQ